MQIFKKNIFKIIAIDNDVKNSFPSNLNIEVIRNIFVIKKMKKKTFFLKMVTLILDILEVI